MGTLFRWLGKRAIINLHPGNGKRKGIASVDISNTGGAVLSVHQLNHQVRQLLESSFGLVQVEGEISNFAMAGSGHWYFSLKDDRAQVRCAMFRNRNPADGQTTGEWPVDQGKGPDIAV